MTKSLASLVLITFTACQGNGAPTTDAAVGPRPDAGIPGNANGLVSVREYTQPSQVWLSGSFSDGPDLDLRVESQRIGACRLMTFTPSFCDPACANSDFCVDGQCQSWPGRLDKGPIEWTWPGGQQTVIPDSILLYSASGALSGQGTTSLMVDGETLQVETVGDIVAIGDWSNAVATRTGDVVLRWANPLSDARVRLQMTDCSGSHGGIGAVEIECESSDTGELTLPGAFLDALDQGDWSRGECGSHDLIRYRSASSMEDTFRFETYFQSGFYYFPRP